MHKGSCLCGAVTFEVDGSLPDAEACHCTKCRRWTGHFGVSVDVPRDRVTIHGADSVRWFQSSEKARRGFCSACGTTLFFDPIDKQKHAWLGIYLGAFELPTGTKLAFHIFVAEKGDYYEITDGLPQNEY